MTGELRPRARNRCTGRETTSKSLQRPTEHVVSLGANLLGGAPIRLTTSDEDGPSVSLVTTRSRQADTGTDRTAVFVGGGACVENNGLHACASVAAMLSWLDLIM